MTLPNFLIIGAQKSGTSWLANKLAQHPDIFVVPYEVHYFDWDFQYARGTDWYAEQFAEANGEHAIGEKTPEYLQTNVKLLEGHNPDTHHAIHRLMPEGRLIAILRDPVDRAASSARHLVHTGRVAPTTDLDAFMQSRLKKMRTLYDLVLSYGYYYERLRPFFDLFEREQLLVLNYERDVRADPAGGLRKATTFLGVDNGFVFRDLDERVNTFMKSKVRLMLEFHAKPLSRAGPLLDRYFPSHRWTPAPETVAHLRDVYADDAEHLRDLLGDSGFGSS